VLQVLIFQQTLAAFEYMEHADVKSRMQHAIQNVRLELSNIKDLTGEDIKDTKGAIIDLPALWIEYMKNHLQTMEDWGQEYVEKLAILAEKLYKAEITQLDKIEKKLVAEDRLKGAQKTKNDKERKTLTDKLEKELVALKNDKDKADKDEATKRAALKVVQDAMDAAKSDQDREDEKKKGNFEIKEDLVKEAEDKSQTALRAANTKQRRVYEANTQPLQTVIADLNKDLKDLATFKAAAKKIKMPPPQ
jgi:hypothetical protein